MKKISQLFFMALFCVAGRDSSAQTIDLSPYVKKKQFILAGTINPPSVSLNGQQLETPNGDFKNLYVNGNLVPVTTTENLKTFYFSVESDGISLDWEKLNNERQNFLNLQLPSLTRLTTNGSELNWGFSSTVTKALLDSDEISMDTPKIHIQNIKEWVMQPHALELIANNNLSQMYNLDFSMHRPELFRRYSAYYSLGEPSLNYFWQSTASGFGAAIHFEDDRYLDVNYLYTEKDRTLDFDSTHQPIVQRLYQLKSRYGYQVFSTNWNNFDLFRLTLGFQGEITKYERTSTTVQSFDGFNTDKVDSSYAVVGAFLRWEPVQYKNWGLALIVDFPLAATIETSKIMTVPSLSINYYFK